MLIKWKVCFAVNHLSKKNPFWKNIQNGSFKTVILQLDLFVLCALYHLPPYRSSSMNVSWNHRDECHHKVYDWQTKGNVKRKIQKPPLRRFGVLFRWFWSAALFWRRLLFFGFWAGTFWCCRFCRRTFTCHLFSP